MRNPEVDKLIDQTEKLILDTRKHLDNLKASQEHHEQVLKELRESLARLKADIDGL